MRGRSSPKNTSGRCKEGLQKNIKTLGLIVLETNLGIDAQDVYRYYKARWAIETYYDRMRDRKRHETFLNTVYSYETRKPWEKQKKRIRQEMKTIP